MRKEDSIDVGWSQNQIGLPIGVRRRTPGLRREEVAVAAGVSTTWYTYLEQGRDIRVSHDVLACIADALHRCIFTAEPNSETEAKLHRRLRDPALL